MKTLPRRNPSPRRNHHPSGLRYDSSTTIGGPSHPSAILRLHAIVYVFDHRREGIEREDDDPPHFPGEDDDPPTFPALALLPFQAKTEKKNLSQSSEFLEKLWSGVGCTLRKTNRTEQGVEHVPDYKREQLGSLQNGAMTMKIFMV
ncbi:unnamed protein product [Linum tenue]|uniref:Uncharacterized protein n=1 Tax=Linum tenue TaxID=586396 RepID=A0AAV0HNN9_9ROSI|nr:unnamed protein product [Linum tenue]